MGTSIDCFLLEPSDEAEESLRRFVFSDKSVCKSSGYHGMEVALGRVPWTETHHGRGADDFDHADPRWPKSCACGYGFQPEDQWQHNLTRLWVRKDTGQKWTLSDAPPGAMWCADWLNVIQEYRAKSPDGNVLVLKTPGGDWTIDAKSSNGSGWTRTGVPPKVTAHPSIICGKYHGWLRDGKLVEC